MDKSWVSPCFMSPHLKHSLRTVRRWRVTVARCLKKFIVFLWIFAQRNYYVMRKKMFRLRAYASAQHDTGKLKVDFKSVVGGGYVVFLRDLVNVGARRIAVVRKVGDYNLRIIIDYSGF